MCKILFTDNFSLVDIISIILDMQYYNSFKNIPSLIIKHYNTQLL